MRQLTSRLRGTAGLISVMAVGVWVTAWASAACSSGTTPAATPDSGSDAANTSSSGTTSSSSGTTTSSSSGTTSSSGSSSGPPTTGVCANAGTRALTDTPSDAFIDDFEEAMISLGWSSFSDVMPTPNSFQIMQVAGGAVNTAHSGHYAGTGAKTAAMGGYGVGTVYNAAIDPPHGIYCVDVTAFDGVSFWAKAGNSTNVKIALNFVLPTTNMAMQNDAGMQLGGDCTSSCYNHPRVNFTLTTDWAQYAATFAGASGGTARVQGVIQELAWLSPDSTWDFYLDEIAFYKGTAPTGPVGTGTGGDM